jgi:tRNA modification GTPase
VGGVGIIRVSGPAAAHIAEQLCGQLPPPRLASYARFLDADGRIIDRGLALYFPQPRSFTGEDVLELQAHGGPLLLQLLLRRVMQAGARAARAGEFSQRAFLHGKLDLVQAEAIADLVASGTEAAARAAQRSLAGAFSAQVNDLQQHLTGLRVFAEAAIDFPDDDIDVLDDGALLLRLQQAQEQLNLLLAGARQGRLLRDGIVLAIAGRPNAGKSSLLNALSGQDSAIVTAIPGTTRDILRESIDLDGIPVHLSDTAGIRETTDLIEAEGVRRARAALESADLVLLVIDASDDAQSQLALLQEAPDPQRTIVVFNKMDLVAADYDASSVLPGTAWRSRLACLSALSGAGLPELRRKIREALGAAEQTEGAFSARQRHVDALHRTLRHLAAAEQRLTTDRAAELLAEELRLAQQALGEITGETLPDDLLGSIFASFCIGK